MLVKRHEARDPAEKAAAPRTLFVTHVDNFVTEAQLSRCFANGFGPVETVVLKSVEKKAPRIDQRVDQVRTFVNFARVVFKEVASLDKALASAAGRVASQAVLPPPVSEFKEQLKASKAFYRDPVELRQEIDAWMANYDEQEEAKRRAARESAVDEDGFTKVVAGITRTADGLAIRAAKRPELQAGAFAEPVKATQASASVVGKKKSRGSREQPDFYRFQLREKRRQEIVDHRKRSADDMDKVLHMRKAKRFKVPKAP